MKLRPLPFLALLLLGAGVDSARAETRIAGAAQPQLVAAADGRVWLAYGQDHDVLVARSDDGGKTFQPPTKVTTEPELLLGMRRGPRLAVHGDRLTITLIAAELVSFQSADAGRTWTGPVKVNDAPASAQEGLHDLAASPNGELFVTWLDNRSGTMELWGAASADGGRSWSKNQRVYKSPAISVCECCHPSALFDAEGNLAVMWRNSIDGMRDMWMMTRPRGASQFGPARKVGEGSWPLKGCPMDGGRIVALGGGRFGAVFQRAGEVFLASDDGSEKSLGRGKQPVAAVVGASPLVLWQDGSDLVAMQTGQSPKKQAPDARFATIVALPGGHGAVLAYEQGAAKERRPEIVIERL